MSNQLHRPSDTPCRHRDDDGPGERIAVLGKIQEELRIAQCRLGQLAGTEQVRGVSDPDRVRGQVYPPGRDHDLDRTREAVQPAREPRHQPRLIARRAGGDVQRRRADQNDHAAGLSLARPTTATATAGPPEARGPTR